MGIQGLLPLLKSIMNPIHIKELKGCFVAVDTYSWLHKGALSCSTELCKGQRTSKHIDYCMHRVNMLRHYGVKPILVFDGGPLPMKSEQEIKRARSRRENLSRAVEHESNGNRSAAYECYQKAVDITPSVAYDLIQVLKQENVSYVVAPYEADAQMTFLALSKHVDAVITEDSDLIAFGCPRIIYKMDKFGQGVEFKNTTLQYNKELNLAGFTQMMLLEMCILSGCDYLPSLPGMGLKKAYTLMKKFKSHENVLKHLKYNKVEVTPLYEESFKKAIMTFRHQRVYDPISEDIVHLSEPLGVVSEDLDFLGPPLPQHVAKGIAQGDIDPFTKVPLQRESGTPEKVLHGTYQLKNFKPDGERKKLDLPAQKNLAMAYVTFTLKPRAPKDNEDIYYESFLSSIIIGFASLEAKRKFKAPRITPKHPNDSNETSSPRTDVHEVKHGSKIDELNFMEAQDHGQCDDMRVAANTEMKPFMAVQNSVCKPCISLHKGLDSDRENMKSSFVNENGLVRSSYFLKTSKEENGKENKSCVGNNGDNILENVISNHVYESLSGRNEEKRLTVQNSHFRHNIKQNAGDCHTKVDNRIFSVRSSYFEETSLKENNETHESEDMGIRGGVDAESLEGTTKKRKIVQTDSPISIQEGSSDKNLTSDIDEETKPEEGKFGCNISHLDRYSNIAEKSIAKFVSVISSFRYNSSGSRASGLRAPLKDIKNNCTKSSTTTVDLKKFAYVPTRKTTPSRCPKTKV